MIAMLGRSGYSKFILIGRTFLRSNGLGEATMVEATAATALIHCKIVIPRKPRCRSRPFAAGRDDHDAAAQLP
jgi:hypothetical protein